MTFDWKHIVMGVFIGLLGAGLVLSQVQSCSRLKANASLSDSLTIQKRINANLWSSIRDNKVIHSQDSIRYDSLVLHPKLVRYIKHDTIDRPGPSGEAKLCEGWYADRVTFGRTTLDYAIHDKDCNPELWINEIVSPVDSFYFAPHDTCINPPKPKYFLINHLLLDFDLIGSNLKQFPNIDCMLGWMIRDRIKLNIGVEMNFYHKEPYAKIGIGIPLK